MQRFFVSCILACTLLAASELAAQKLRITAPTTSVKWYIGDYHAITWTGVAPSSRVSLSYSTNAGAVWNLISDSAYYNSYIWKVPNVRSSACLLRADSYKDSLIILSGHGSLINTGSYSHDGKMVATASDDNTAKVWSAMTGELLRTFVGHTEDVMFAAFSPDDTKLLTASSDRTGRIWDIATGQLIATLNGHTDGLNYCDFNPDGALVITSSEDGTARLWSATTGELLRTFLGHSAGLYSAFFHPLGNKFITASRDKSVIVWDVQTGSILRRILHPDIVHWACWNADGSSIVTACRDKNAYVYDGSTYALITPLIGNSSWVWSAEFSNDKKWILTGGRDGTARIWSSSSYQLTRTIVASDADIGAARFSPDGSSVLTASNDANARIYNFSTYIVNSARTDSLFTITERPVSVEDDQNITFTEGINAAFPNPTDNEFTLVGTPLREIRLYDQFGKLCQTKISDDAGKSVWNCRDLSSGTYYVEYESGNRLYHSPLVIIH